MRQPWDQLDEEDDLWYSRFLLYLNQGPSRTFRAAYVAAGNGSGKERYQISATWSAKKKEHRWAARAAAWDVYTQTKRKESHMAAMAEAWDVLHAGCVKAATTLVNLATNPTDHRMDRIRLSAAESVLDRLGFSRRAPRPIYSDDVTDVDRPVKIELVGLDAAALEKLAGYDDHD